MTPEQHKKKGGARLVKTAKPQKASQKRTKSTTKQKALRVAAIAGIVLLSLITLVGGAYLLFVKPPPVAPPLERPGKEPSVSEPGDVTGDNGEDDNGHTSSDRKKDVYTFLMVGRDTYGGGNTDTMMLAAYDVPNQQLNVMSLPRDTLVNVSWDIKKLNSVYNMYGGKDEGMDALKEEISQLVGFRPDFTVTVEWKAVGELVNAVGGVYFDVPRRMYYNDLSQNFKINLQKGYQKLSGAQAMQLLRYRHDSDDNGNILNSGYPDGDLGRIKVQQDFLKAVIEQCLEKITDVGTITKLAQVFFDNVSTELSVGNLAWFAQQAILGNNGSGRLTMENVSFITMPWVNANQVRSRTYNNYPSYVAPKVDELVDVVNEHFNPYTTDLQKNELDIMYINKDGTLGCTGGSLQDTKYNSWIVGKGSGSSSTSTPKPSPSVAPPTETDDRPTASPSPSPSGSTSPSPSPSGSTSPSPSPSGSTSPSPSGTASPTPSDSDSPSPTPSASQSPTPSPEPSASSGTDGPPPGIPIISE